MLRQLSANGTPFANGPLSLTRNANPRQWTVGPVIERRIEHRHGQCAEVGIISPRNRFARCGFDLSRRHLTCLDQLTQTYGVEPGVFVRFQRSHSSGRDDGSRRPWRAARRDRVSAARTVVAPRCTSTLKQQELSSTRCQRSSKASMTKCCQGSPADSGIECDKLTPRSSGSWATGWRSSRGASSIAVLNWLSRNAEPTRERNTVVLVAAPPPRRGRPRAGQFFGSLATRARRRANRRTDTDQTRFPNAQMITRSRLASRARRSSGSLVTTRVCARRAHTTTWASAMSLVPEPASRCPT